MDLPIAKSLMNLDTALKISSIASVSIGELFTAKYKLVMP